MIHSIRKIHRDNSIIMSVVNAVANVLETYLKCREEEEYISTSFHAGKTPSISIRQYINRMAQFMKCTEEIFVLALIYIDRVTTRKKDLVINGFCIHRLFLSAMVVAAKFFEDKYYKNSYYCKVGGVTNSELNTLEAEFLEYIDFRLYVSIEDYANYFHTLKGYIGNKTQ